MNRRDLILIALIGFGLALVLMVRLQNPAYTDGYYYFNAGARLATGSGLTDAAVWTYLGLPDSLHGLPLPSHLYWMPLTSIVAALGVFIAGSSFTAARLGFVLIYIGLGLTAYTVGILIGGTRRIGWLAALLTLFGGYFMPYWVNTDTFALYGLVGALALLTMGLGRRSGRLIWFAISGLCCGLGHLTRADGLLLVGVLVIVALWPAPSRSVKSAIFSAGVGIAAYLITMSPLFVRNLDAIGSPLPTGGFQTAWMRSYDEIFNYPPGIHFADFTAWGLDNILGSRLSGLNFALANLIAVEGILILAPFMLYGLWRRRANPLLSGFGVYALGLHLAMVLVFPLPALNGGLWHSSAALMPFWMPLGVLGLDDTIGWLGKRRRWRVKQANRVFSTALIVFVMGFSLYIMTGKTAGSRSAGDYAAQVASHLPGDAVVVINDPAMLYYYTHLSGVRLPTAPPDSLRDLAARFGANYVVLDAPGTPISLQGLYQGVDVPTFLTQVYRAPDFVIYRINP
jgi:4-amino-4-deoxy-L-arabinose transferase-like glycosyltransferase